MPGAARPKSRSMLAWNALAEKECEQILGVRTRLSSHFLDPSPTREEGTNRGGFNLNQRFRPAAQ